MAANDVIAITADAKVSNLYMVVKTLGEVAGLLLTIHVLQQMSSGVPANAVFWDKVRQLSQRSALQLGNLGIQAEQRYNEVMQK